MSSSISSENDKAPLTNSDNTHSVKWSKWHKCSQHLRESIEQGLIACQSVFDAYEGREEYLIQISLSHPLACTANKSDIDTMYMHQTMCDWKQFVRTMQEEINTHTENEHWEVIVCSQVPEGAKVLTSVREMKRREEFAEVEYTSGSPAQPAWRQTGT